MRKFFWGCAQWGLGSSSGSLAKPWIKWSYFGWHNFDLALGWTRPSTLFSLFLGCVCLCMCVHVHAFGGWRKVSGIFFYYSPTYFLETKALSELGAVCFLARLTNKAQGSSHHRLPPHSAGVKGKPGILLQCWGTWGQVLTLTWQAPSPTEPFPRFPTSFSKYIFN